MKLEAEKKGLGWTFKWNLQLKRLKPPECNFLQGRDFCHFVCYMQLKLCLPTGVYGQ